MKAGLLIPTRNAGTVFAELLEQINTQSYPLSRKVIIDTSSEDQTVAIARAHGFEVMRIAKDEFNHGGTRQQAYDEIRKDLDIVLCLTQDVILYDKDSIRQLVDAFHDASVGAAYGRQIPKKGADIEERLQRSFNYPGKSRLKSLSDRDALGIKAPFLSDTFSAYRCTALDCVGGFPDDVPANEDMYVGAKLLLQGYKIAYVAEAAVYHSHQYSCRAMFERYYQTGRFQRQQYWIVDTFGKSEGAGMRLLLYQLRVIARECPSALPVYFMHMCIKYMAYRLGWLKG